MNLERGPEKEVRCDKCGKRWTTRGYGLSATLRGMIRTSETWTYPNICESCAAKYRSLDPPAVKIVSLPNASLPEFD